ncbi:MAG: WD40 repeat domain-containing protein, partial [Verrucomicrobia bacterium]|nr:WD40 repeat domain-containing protein [Verrucomicrobiota bacterium]
ARSDPANHAIGPRLVSVLAQRNFAEPIGEPLVLPTAATTVRYTSDGRHAVTRSPTALQYWDLSSGRQIQRLDVNPAFAHDLSPDAPLIALGYRDGTVNVWDYATGRQVFEPLRHDERISNSGVRFSPDGRWLATVSADRTAKIWDASTGALKTVLQHDAAVLSVGFSPDSARVATISARSWRIWRVPGGEAVLPPKPHSFSRVSVRAITFSPDGTLLAINGTGGAEFRDAATGTPVGARMVHQGLSNQAAFSNDGKMFATTSTNALARLWEVPSGRLLFTLPHDGGTVVAQFTPDDRYLFVCSDDGTARVWNVKTGRQAIEPVRIGDVVAGDLSPNGTEFMTASRDGVVRRWRLALSAAKPLEFPADKDRLAFVRSQSGAATAWAIYSDRMQQIDLLSGRPIESVRIFPTRISAVRLAPNQQRLLVWTADGASETWEFQKNQFTRVPLERWPASGINWRFSVDSTRLAVTSSDGVRVWNADTGVLMAGPFAGASISDLTNDPFSPDGRKLVAVDDIRVIIFDLASGQPVGEPLRHASGARSPVFSPDGRLVATVSSGGIAQLWDAHTTRPHGPPLMHRNTIMRGVRFTRDGQRVLTWNRMAVCVWDVATGRQLVDPIPAGLDLIDAVFSEDGSRIATLAGVGNVVRLWDSKSGQLLSEPAVAAGDFVSQPTFHLAGRFLATGIVGAGRAAQVMALPPPTPGEPVPEWLLRLATALAGAEIDPSGALRERASDAKTLDAIRRELASLRADAPYVEWGRWMFADRATRPLAPGFKITAAEAEKLAATAPSTASVTEER